MRTLVASACLAVAALLLAGEGNFPAAQDKKDPKYSISEVMQQAHGKKGILKKLQAGKGDKADAEKLLEMYIALQQNKPPAGDGASWKKFTDGMVAAAKAAVKGGDEAPKLLKKAVNCQACHKAHKPAE